MKRFSRKWFSQIMINKVLKKDLDLLKLSMKKEYDYNFDLSYGDVVTILVDHYKKNKLEFNLESKLKVGMPLKGHRWQLSSKLNKKRNVSFSLKS